MSEKEGRIRVGRLNLLQEEKRRHLEQNALDREKGDLDRRRLEALLGKL